MTTPMAWVLAAGAGTSALLAPAMPVGAAVQGAIPDSTRMEALRQAIAQAPVFRVRGESGGMRISRPVLDSTGVRSMEWGVAARRRPALLVTADAPRPSPRPSIPWSEISSLEVARPCTVQGAVAGAIVGLALGATVVSGRVGRSTDEGAAYETIGIFGTVVTTSTILGAILGHRSGTRTIYRAQTRETN
jgi:hypothetical protein